MKASIIIPAFNVEKFVSKTLDSAINQTFRGDYEIIIVDDGSTDRTKDISKDYAAKYPNLIRYFEQKNKGSHIARNTAMKKARGEIFLFLDSDDLFLSQTLESCVNYLEVRPDCGLVYSNQSEIDSGGDFLGERRREGCHRYFGELIKFCMFAGHVRATPKKVIEEIGGFDERLRTAQDWSLTLKIHERYRVDHIPKILYKYRVHDYGVTNRQRNSVVDTSKFFISSFLKRNKVYGDSEVEVKCVNVKDNISYYEHIVNGKTVLPKKLKKVLVDYLSS